MDLRGQAVFIGTVLAVLIPALAQGEEWQQGIPIA